MLIPLTPLISTKVCRWPSSKRCLVLNESKDGVQFFKSSQLGKVNESNNIFIEVRNEKKLCISEMADRKQRRHDLPTAAQGRILSKVSTILTSTCFDSKRLSKGTAE